LELGFSPKAIEHRLATGRLHRIRPGVYAAGRPRISIYGHWMAAVLSCGPRAVLSHGSAAALWRIRSLESDRFDVSVPASVSRRPTGIVVHRRVELTSEDVTDWKSIPVTTPICTLIDIATYLTQPQLEAAINEADKRDLVDPEALRAAVHGLSHRRGTPALRETLDRRTFTLTDSDSCPAVA
jgi:hypothetical protein